jgi:GNAT superfamily N-acetyltransferase
MTFTYTIRRARSTELQVLPDIERAAAAMFRDTPHPQLADAPLSSDHLDATDLVWFALDLELKPVGFAIVSPMTTAMHLQEIAVLPEHARRGIGARLIDAVARWASEHGVDQLTLSTCDDIPWNGPYYSRLGFRALSELELTPDLKEIRRVEAAAGLPMKNRICMVMGLNKRLGGG